MWRAHLKALHQAVTLLLFTPTVRVYAQTRLRIPDVSAVSSAGDLTDGAASTGPVLSHGSNAAAGFICVIEADASGRAEFLTAALNSSLQV